jgi:hypothetical protein
MKKGLILVVVVKFFIGVISSANEPLLQRLSLKVVIIIYLKC